MKWNNKGHEYDERYRLYSRAIEKHDNSFFVFGAGVIGEQGVRFFERVCWKVSAVIDNSSDKQGKLLLGKAITSFDEYLRNKKGYIVVCVSDKHRQSVYDQLAGCGLEEGIDYCGLDAFISDFVPIVSLYRDNRLYLNIVELALTERCTLKCKKCAHGCEYVSMNREDMSLDIVRESADQLFRLVDHVDEFYLIGGEPLIYKDMHQAIEYIGGKYREKIDRFIITTNGTIIPSEDILKFAKEYSVTFYISNYSAQIPRLEQNYERFTHLLDEHDIDYALSPFERQWMDYGFDYVNHGFDEETVISVLDHCHTQCREIRGSRFYFCIQARAVSENMGFDVDADDYLELSDLVGSDAKKVLFEYSKGYSDKGYIDMCNYCNGSECFKYLIPAAEQLQG